MAFHGSRTQTFFYDDADRLREWRLTYPTVGQNHEDRTSSYGYDDLGNVTSVFVDGLLTEVHELDPVKPHRLASIDFLFGAGVRDYHHDARGRQHQDTDGRQIQYTPFDLPKHIAQSGTETTFAYDAFGTRVKKTTFEGAATTTTITLGGLYERRERIEGATTTVQHVYYVHGDDGPVAQVVYDESTQEETTAYLARDGLGSISLVFDKNGAPLERFYHEPFGRRVGVDGEPLQHFAPSSSVAIGFTGQRHDDDLDLIDMNGRVYDPMQKRFLTPDPLVSNPFFSQSHNRYAYVLNNPLRYTDPSGFELQPVSSSVVVPTNVEHPHVVDSAPPPRPATKGGSGPRTNGSPGNSDGRGQSPPTGATAAPEPQSGVTQAIGPEWIEEDHDDVPGASMGGIDGDLLFEDFEAVEAEAEPSWRDNSAVQGLGGFVAGLALGVVPFGGIGEGIAREAGLIGKGTRAANIGKGLGEVVGGLAQFYLGAGGTVGGGLVSASGLGAAVGVPVAVASATLAAGGLANVGAGLANVWTSLSTGGGSGPSAATSSSLGSKWKPRDIKDAASETGCEKVARQIKKRIGGKIYRIVPNEGRFLDAYREKSWRWFHHEVVVKDGRVYDAFGPSEGLPIDEFKALWSNQQSIGFGF